MKTKELIYQLQLIDPEGETECCIYNAAITGITPVPAYYDGALQIVEEDEEGRPVKGHRTRKGKKIWIESMHLHEHLTDKDFVIEYETEEDKNRYEKSDLAARQHDKEIEWEVEQNIFTEWIFLKLQKIKPITPGWFERITEAAHICYKDHRGPDVDGKAIKARDWGWKKGSWKDRLFDLWEEIIFVDWDNYSRIIIKFKD